MTPAVPECIGRYRIQRLLGQGSYGSVYLAQDEQLNRGVAIKIPHRRIVATKDAAESHLSEARMVASLDHPNIVPVFDVGSTPEHPCFVVSKYVEGETLATRLRKERVSFNAAAELTATLAEALHYAHRTGIIHRDIKPGNILLDHQGKPHIVDFGVALRDKELRTGPTYAGTPAYMSPEQARGEGHRVDARSDVFSLGVVFYELLTGRQPFRAESLEATLVRVSSHEPRPPRQVIEDVPKELDRICMKAISKRASDRYSSAKDFADDARTYLLSQTPVDLAATLPATVAGAKPGTASAGSSVPGSKDTSRNFSLGQPIKIVPKGLRSFGAHDADFFLELLPGARDRAGLPESIRFWKSFTENPEPDPATGVGLIYGPSGCGKSSLIKAGFLPRLSDDIIAIYLECTANETESRLLAGLRKRCPELPANLNLQGTLAALRQGEGMPTARKVLIILDQFEQWLHARRTEETSDLVLALRQCDAARVQCIVMVRDDFWMAATRFFRELEIPLVEGRNSAAVDLFDPSHARKVLAAYGRAMGKLPDPPAEIDAEHKAFLDQAVTEISEDGKVICVRLALFAEMMKGRKDWTRATLKAVGGAAGIGVSFLEDTFGASAPPSHRYHQAAARAVLKALLPEAGTDIKGNMRSNDELLAASGYQDRSKDFAELISILDGELRLITPTDPAGAAGEGDTQFRAKEGRKYFQLAHDYLVPSLREWMTLKQRQTRRGRAELRLAELAANWSARPEARNLPNLGEYLGFLFLTSPRNWKSAERVLMRQAARTHGFNTAVSVVMLGFVAFLGVKLADYVVEQRNATYTQGLVDGLMNAETAQLPSILADLQPYRKWADPLLKERFETVREGTDPKLHLALALLPTDPTQVDYLRRRLLKISAAQFPTVRQALSPHKNSCIGPLWETLGAATNSGDERFQAACALASFDSENERWKEVTKFVAARLVRVLPTDLSTWQRELRPVQEKLIDPLEAISRNPAEPEQTRTFAADSLAEFTRGDANQLFKYLAEAEAFQFPAVFAKLGRHKERIMELATAALAQELKPAWKDRAFPGATPDPQWTNDIAASQGLVHERFAYCQTMEMKRYAAVLEGLRSAGYRPTRCRPYADGEVIRVAGIWARDERKWEWAENLSEEQLRVKDAEMRSRGLQPVDVAGYIHNGADVYAALWAEAVNSNEEVRLFLDGRQDFDQLKRDGFVPRTCQMRRTVATPSEPCGVWVKQVLDWELRWHLTPAQFDTHPTDRLATDVAILNGKYTTVYVHDREMEFDALLDVSPKEHVKRSVKLAEKGYRPMAITVGQGTNEIFAGSLWHRPQIPFEELESNAHRQARVALSLMKLGEAERAFPILKTSPDLTARSSFIHWVSLLGSDWPVLVNKLQTTSDPAIRSALVLSLGELDQSQLPESQREPIVTLLLDLYEGDADPGVHGATEWLLGRWGQTEKLAQRKAKFRATEDKARADSRQWYINSIGQTFAIIDANEFQAGLPTSDPDHKFVSDTVRKVRIGRRLAVATKEVTWAEYDRSLKDRGSTASTMKELNYPPLGDMPRIQVTWFNAAAYCNWLSKNEGIPEDQWCYEPGPNGEFGSAMKMRVNYLSLSGYRLPTIAEWEFFCRAGTVTARHYGRGESLLPYYAWFRDNAPSKPMPVGLLKPNDFGLFDTLGNVMEFIQDAVPSGSRGTVVGFTRTGVIIDAPPGGPVGNAIRHWRGGQWGDLPREVHVSRVPQGQGPPGVVSTGMGFRPVRTLALIK